MPQQQPWEDLCCRAEHDAEHHLEQAGEQASRQQSWEDGAHHSERDVQQEAEQGLERQSWERLARPAHEREQAREAEQRRVCTECRQSGVPTWWFSSPPTPRCAVGAAQPWRCWWAAAVFNHNQSRSPLHSALEACGTHLKSMR